MESNVISMLSLKELSVVFYIPAKPLHGECMFVKDEDVEQFVLSHPDSSKPTEVCKVTCFRLAVMCHYSHFICC